jgi:hypothetical protein
MLKRCFLCAPQWMRFGPIRGAAETWPAKGGPREKCAPGVPPEKMCPKVDVWKGANPLKNGADSGNRTPDLLITNQLLYP